MFSWDKPIFDFFWELNQSLFLANWFLIFFGNILAYILAFVFAVRLLLIKGFKKQAYYFSLAVLSLILSRGVITELFRFFIDSPRPFVSLGLTPVLSQAATNSMPSGHMAFFIPLGLTAFYLNRPWGIRFLILVFIMGVARVAAGLHWPSDILAGVLIGVASFYFVKALLPRRLTPDA
jgi:membrane-associated phospholipid phosphatase